MNPPGNFEIALDAGRSLSGILDLPSLPGPRPTVLICHGFKGFMEWGFFPYLAALLAERGFVAVRFNFSGSGMQAGDELVTDTEAFGTATHSKDLAELGYYRQALVLVILECDITALGRLVRGGLHSGFLV